MYEFAMHDVMDARAMAASSAQWQSPAPGNSCEDERCDHRSRVIFYCVDCDSSYCETCWKLQVPHKPGKKARDGIKHDKSNWQLYKVYKDILHPPNSADTLREMHLSDAETLWFGVTKDDDGQPKLEDHGRYASLMRETAPIFGTSDDPKYPQLVSFVGQTNAGKSTLINMLIGRHQLEGAPKPFEDFPSPVVGSAANDKVPTSGDVHLYADPSTSDTNCPRLYADCEGMDGGENLPYGSQSHKKIMSMENIARLTKKLKLSNTYLGRKSRQLKWAIDDKTKKREYAVTELYPRLLYTFSDVVVFVLKNPKVFESQVLVRLLDWGAAALEKSVNQPTLPHAVIVFNATDVGVDDEEWDHRKATQNLLDLFNNSFDKHTGIPELKELAEKWRIQRKTVITSVKDLIEKYYASFTVVRMPEKGRYNLMDQQAQRLQQIITERCAASFNAKRRARMDSNADELNVYLQAAFDHFADDLNKPFNFMEASLKCNPVPDDFGGHIYRLAKAIQGEYQYKERITGQMIFQRLGRMVASCIMLDCVTKNRKGAYQEMFRGYSQHLVDVIGEFCDMSWPCEFVSAGGERCVNVRSAHESKGHQDATGNIFAPGSYQSSFEHETFSRQWSSEVEQDMITIMLELQRLEEKGRPSSNTGTGSTPEIALGLHRDRISTCFESLGTARRYISHSTCFCCLQNVPEHCLPCGHVLCSSCVQAYGNWPARTDKHNDWHGDNVWVMKFCPLHWFEPFSEPWKIRFKPKHAGVRVLSLDGGGIRGVVELEVLRYIEQTIGHNLPIQAFFDLIVGTSTGGIIALALGVKQWSVAECANRFIALCNEAFIRKGFFGIKPLSFVTHGTMYKTTCLLNTLRESMGLELLFGGKRQQNQDYAIKVAVTATTITGREAVVIANYGRGVTDDSEQYRFLRTDDPKSEFCTFEAAAATSAAPGYFKPFYHERSNMEFMDGALHYNNPAFIANAERKLLWPDVAELAPDILLSIGTGIYKDAVDKVEEESMQPAGYASGLKELWGGSKASAKPASKNNQYRAVKTFKMLCKRLEDVLDAERAWRDFKANNAVHGSWPSTSPLPYFRLNPELDKKPPRLDEKDEITLLKQKVMHIIRESPVKEDIQRIAFHLVASTFYLAKDTLPRDSVTHIVTGRIRCRFEDNKDNVRNLGKLLRHQQGPNNYGPYFVVHDETEQTKAQRIPITEKLISSMVNRATFDAIPIEIEVWDRSALITVAIGLRAADWSHDREHAEEFPISGFPQRVLEDENKLARQTSPEPSKLPPKNRLTTRGKHKKDSGMSISTSTTGESISELPGSPSVQSPPPSTANPQQRGGPALLAQKLHPRSSTQSFSGNETYSLHRGSPSSSGDLLSTNHEGGVPVVSAETLPIRLGDEVQDEPARFGAETRKALDDYIDSILR